MRADGKRVKKLKPFFEIIPYIMNRRVDAQNYIMQEIDATAMREYIAQKRGSGAGISHLSLVITAFFKTALEYEQLNYFVVNKKIYHRNHFCVSFVTLKSDGGDERTEQTVSKLFFEPGDDIFSISKKINDAIGENREIETSNDMDKLLGRLMRFPGLAWFSVGMLKILDRYGLLPRKVLDASPFHTSLFVTNMASIRSNPIYHHLYEFGTTSIFAAIGQSKKRIALQRNGHLKEKTVLPIGIVTDERIASGHYYVEAFRKMERYLKNPELLENKSAQEPESGVRPIPAEEPVQAARSVKEPVSLNGDAAAQTGNLRAAYKIAWTQFRGSRRLFPSLREIWYDRELSRAIDRLERPFVPFFVLLAGLFGIGLALAGKASQEQILLAMGIFVLVDVLFITPLLFYAVLPKPIAAHIKRLDSLSEEEWALYEEEQRANEKIDRIFNRYRVPGRPEYKDHTKY